MTGTASKNGSSACALWAAVMFVRLDGLSRLVERKDPTTLLNELRERLTHISSIVQSNGGIVNKVLGDSILCLFASFSENPSTQSNDHENVRAAVQTAVTLQRDWASRLLKLEDTSREQLLESIESLPIRIGINYGKMIWGDVGIQGVVDLTALGEPLNLAKRLESASEPFMILVGPAVKDSLDEANQELDFHVGAAWGRRFLQLQRQSGMFEAWECNAFARDENLLKTAQRLVRTGNKRASPRVPWMCQVPLNVELADGQIGRVVDFSENGFCLEFPSAFARKDQFEVTVCTGRADWNLLLVSKGLSKITCDVRWVEKVGTANWHGVAFVGFPQEFAKALSDLLIQFNNRAGEEA